MSDKWPHIVGLAGILTGATVTMFSSWSSNQVSIELEKLKANIEHQAKEDERKWLREIEHCKNLTISAQRIAKANAEVVKDLNVKNRSEIDANLWAGVTLLSEDRKKEFLKRYTKGPNPEDKYDYLFTRELVAIALKELAIESIGCGKKDV